MNYPKITFSLLLTLLVCPLQADTIPPVRDLMADTWVATDALGRTTPTPIQAGQPRRDKRRTVGIFYITWHTPSLHDGHPYSADVSRVLQADPQARLHMDGHGWTTGSYHWGEPEYGYFLSQDPYVIRHDMSMLADAGVDVIILDVTNAVCYWDEWEVLFRTMEQMKREGNQVPQFCFWAYNGNVITVVEQLYERIYQAHRYSDLWFRWQGHPLLLYNARPTLDANGGGVKNRNPHFDPKAATDPNHPHYRDPAYCEEYLTDYTDSVKRFFTLRNMWWGYYEWGGKRYVGTEDNWSFGYEMNDDRVAALTPTQLAATHQGRLEEMAVTPAQHPISITGKSWRRGSHSPALDSLDLPSRAYVPWLGRNVNHPSGYGIYFQDRWDEALRADPDFIYLNDWNEWTAGKYPSGKAPGSDQPGPTDFLGRKNPFYFVDQYNAEFNRTLQPVRGQYTDNYYMQMVENIRRYKGARPLPQSHGYHRIAIDARFGDWSSITPAYFDTHGDICHRDFDGYGNLHYVDTLGRNDILLSRVALDQRQVYFQVETAANLTPSSGPLWMLLFIDADCNSHTGWYGYDYVVHLRVKDATTTTLMHYDSLQHQWRHLADIPYRVSGRRMELSVPRRLLGLLGRRVSFDFKWVDHPARLVDPISLSEAGDTAPNRRFNYRFIWSR